MTEREEREEELLQELPDTLIILAKQLEWIHRCLLLDYLQDTTHELILYMDTIKFHYDGINHILKKRNENYHDLEHT